MLHSNCAIDNVSHRNAPTTRRVINQEQFKQSWGQLEGHFKKHWGKLTNEDYALIDGDLQRFNDVIEQRYGAINGDVSKGVDRWYVKWAGWYEGYEEAQSES